MRPSLGVRGSTTVMSVPVGVAGGAQDEAGLGEAEPVAQEERQRGLVERVAGGVAVRLRVEDADPGAVGDHHGALGLVVLEADAAGLGEVEGAGLGGAVRVGLGEAALGGAHSLEVAVDRADVDALGDGRQGGGEGQGGERDEEGAAVHAAGYSATSRRMHAARHSHVRQPGGSAIASDGQRRGSQVASRSVVA